MTGSLWAHQRAIFRSAADCRADGAHFDWRGGLTLPSVRGLPVIALFDRETDHSLAPTKFRSAVARSGGQGLPVLRGCAGYQGADRDRGAATDRRTLCDRGRRSRSIACAPARGAPQSLEASRRGDAALVRSAAPAAVRTRHPAEEIRLRALALGAFDALLHAAARSARALRRETCSTA